MQENNQSPKMPWLAYKVGDKNRDGSIITFIVVKDPDLAIYFVKGEDSFVFEYVISKYPHAPEAFAISKALNSRVSVSIPKRQRHIAYSLIASAFFVALTSGGLVKENNYFADVEQFIDNKSNESIHLKYVFAAIAFAILSVIPPLLYFQYYGKTLIYHILVGGSFGACGSLVSLLTRFREVVIPKYSSWIHTSLNGFTRILIGTIFGAMLILMQQSGVVLTFIGTNQLLLYMFAFGSGLSERYVPDLIQNLQKRSLE
jgi:hypothetical protein